MYVFGGYDGQSRVNDFYEFHFPTKSWREILTLSSPSEGSGGRVNAAAAGFGSGQRPYGVTITAAGTAPSPRDRHAAVVHGSSFYIFGGFDGASRVCDLYGFDVNSLVWREVRPRIAPANRTNNLTVENGRPGDTGTVGSSLIGHPQQNVAHSGLGGEGLAIPQQLHPPPSPRHSHAAVVYKNSMYIFGGYDGSYRSDFHEFDFDQLMWKPVLASGRSPRARYRSTTCVRGDMMILFGGHDGTRHLADVHLFDFINQVWSLLVANGVPPLPRDSHVSVAHNDSMFVFGGSTGSAMNDLYELNFHSIQQESSQGDAPAAREHGHNARNGPEDGGGPAAVTQEALATSAKWRQTPMGSGGNAIHRFCHVGAVHKGSLYIFGGYDGSNRLNDFVKYDLAAENLFETDIPPPTLLSDLRSFLDDEDVMSFADVTLMVEGVPVRAHKLMLMRCPYFRAMLLGDMVESSQSVVNLEIVRHSTFTAVLEYLYTDTVAIPLDSAMELFVAADCFDIPRLQALCERRLLESMTVKNAAAIFHTADVHSATLLRDKALAYILSHFEAVSKTAAFEEMVRSNVELVFEILKRR
ncbi:hypothetical protein ACHAXR_004325 [Thalassiosira sp. AJA248-18]